jgi:hypothetical protein
LENKKELDVSKLLQMKDRREREGGREGGEEEDGRGSVGKQTPAVCFLFKAVLFILFLFLKFFAVLTTCLVLCL